MKKNIIRYLFLISGPIWAVIVITMIIIGVNNSWFTLKYTDAHVVTKGDGCFKIKYDNDSRETYIAYKDKDIVDEIEDSGIYTEQNDGLIVVFIILFIGAFAMIGLFSYEMSMVSDFEEAEARAWITYGFLRFIDRDANKPDKSLYNEIFYTDMSFANISKRLLNNKNEEKC